MNALSIASSSFLCASPFANVTTASASLNHHHHIKFREKISRFFSTHTHTIFIRHFKIHDRPPTSLPVTNYSQSQNGDSSVEKSEADKLVDGMDFGELCNEFQCISSPSVEATARQLARDILELRQANNALAVSVTYKDPVRSFTGREKYKSPLWTTDALDEPTVCVQEMVMLSTSVLRIKWIIKGRPKFILASVVGDVIVKVNSEFTLNQISGQVIEHIEHWDLSASTTLAQAYFWTSRQLSAAVEAGTDVIDFVEDFTSRSSTKQENIEVYPDTSADPTKFFQRDDNFQKDMYQIVLFMAIIYFVVQLLRTTL